MLLRVTRQQNIVKNDEKMLQVSPKLKRDLILSLKDIGKVNQNKNEKNKLVIYRGKIFLQDFIFLNKFEKHDHT